MSHGWFLYLMGHTCPWLLTHLLFQLGLREGSPTPFVLCQPFGSTVKLPHKLHGTTSLFRPHPWHHIQRGAFPRRCVESLTLLTSVSHDVRKERASFNFLHCFSEDRSSVFGTVAFFCFQNSPNVPPSTRCAMCYNGIFPFITSLLSSSFLLSFAVPPVGKDAIQLHGKDLFVSLVPCFLSI